MPEPATAKLYERSFYLLIGRQRKTIKKMGFMDLSVGEVLNVKSTLNCIAAVCGFKLFNMLHIWTKSGDTLPSDGWIKATALTFSDENVCCEKCLLKLKHNFCTQQVASSKVFLWSHRRQESAPRNIKYVSWVKQTIQIFFVDCTRYSSNRTTNMALLFGSPQYIALTALVCYRLGLHT